MVCGHLPSVKCCQKQGTCSRLPIRCTSPHPCQHQWATHSYKYLGTTIDDKLRWDDNIMNLYKKGQQRLYFLRILNALHIDRNILFMFHDSFVKSVMLVGKSPSQKQRKTQQNIHNVLQNRYVLYTRYQSGATVQVKNTANGNQNLI